MKGEVAVVRFTHQDELFVRAVELGCTPVRTSAGWECRCFMATHAISTTYAVITVNSLARFSAEAEKGER